MTTALEIGAAFLSATTLLAAAMLLAAFQLGRLVTRDDEQREVAAGPPKVAVQDLVAVTGRRTSPPMCRSIGTEPISRLNATACDA